MNANQTNNYELETHLVKLLKKSGKTIATCESCTGGLISKRITNVSGASDVFGYGVCTYANEAKIKLLGVSEETLANYGAVSPYTAQEMACGMRKLSGADIAISTTGIAGPSGGTDKKPVGLVYTAISASDGYNECAELLLCEKEKLNREQVRFAASSEAIKLAIRYLEKFNA